MKKARIQLEQLACPSCNIKIEGALKALDGLDKDSIDVGFNSSRVQVDFDESKISLEEIEKAIADQGYIVLSSRAR